MKKTIAVFLTVAAAFAAMGAGPILAADEDAPARATFFKDVLPILQQNCQDCHRPSGDNIMGMVAPMSFLTYEEVRPWAKSISKQVQARTMPPWHASEAFDGIFSNERKLDEMEIATIVRWAASGAPRGRAQDGPQARAFTSADGWKIGKPDLIVAFDEPFFIADSVQDQYQVIMVTIPEEQLPEDRWIQAMEFRPGSQAVHHIVIFTDGQRESLGFPMGMLGGMGPGTDATVFPDGYGRVLHKGTTLTFNMHYHKEPGPGTGVWDRSAIGLKFQDKPVRHEVRWGAVGTMAFRIPPNNPNYEVTAEETFGKDTTLLALFPHMHLRAKASKYVAYYPDGSEEVLLDVPNYDFNWQTNYVFEEPKLVPAGTRIKVHMWYDNSKERAELAGIDPSRSVGFGQPTTDEMMFGWIDYCDTEPMTE